MSFSTRKSRSLLVALECRLCKECGKGIDCPVNLGEMPVEQGAQRIINLIAAWHSQLIEVMGAMGMREVRRLRGEAGRAMFYDDLEKDNFAPIFGERKRDFISSGIPDLDAAILEFSTERQMRTPTAELWSFPPVEDQITLCGSRYRNRLSKYRVIRTNACRSCGKCTEVCGYHVHEKAGNRMVTPKSCFCHGPDVCMDNGTHCADACPEHAIYVTVCCPGNLLK